MKQLVLFLSMIFVFGGIALKSQESTETTTENGPKIKFDKKVHNYGKIEKESDGICYFTITNEGNEPLILNNVRAGCKCTVPSWPKEPIAPGESAKIKVKYNTRIIGKINKSITVTYNGGQSREVLRITGEVINPQQSAPVNENNQSIPTSN